MRYKLLLLEAYEDEVAGAAYFERLGLAYPEQSAFLEKCAALERDMANRLSALLRKYRLEPRSRAMLEERGALDARRDAGGGWQRLMLESIQAYARYVEEFKALEAIGPLEDQRILAALTAHEIQLIEWMRVENESSRQASVAQ